MSLCDVLVCVCCLCTILLGFLCFSRAMLGEDNLEGDCLFKDPEVLMDS